MIATATSAAAPASPGFPISILQNATAGDMNTSEASSKQWIIAFGIAVATAVSYKMTRRHRGLHAHFLPITKGLAAIGAVCMYPELLMMGIGLISALGACEKSFRRHFFWAMTHFGDVVRPLFNAASSLLKMIFQPIVICICFKLTTTACKNLLPWNDKDLQDLEIIFAAVAQVSTLGVVCYHYYKWTTAGIRFSFQCWVLFCQPFIGILALPIYFVESASVLVCRTAYSFFKGVALALFSRAGAYDTDYVDESGWWGDSSDDSDYEYDGTDDDSIFGEAISYGWIRGERLRKLDPVDYRRFYIGQYY
jgi:hypothetical protein